MTDSLLQLNEEKTEVLVCVPRQICAKGNGHCRPPFATFTKSSIRNRWGQLFKLLDDRVKSLAHSCFFLLTHLLRVCVTHITL